MLTKGQVSDLLSGASDRQLRDIQKAITCEQTARTLDLHAGNPHAPSNSRQMFRTEATAHREEADEYLESLPLHNVTCSTEKE